VAFIHRFGSTLNPRLHFHCVVIDGVFDSAAAAGVVFHAAIGIDADAIAQVQAWVRRRVRRSFVHRGLLPGDDARAMGAHGAGFSVDGSVRIEAVDRAGCERLPLLSLRRPALERPSEFEPDRLVCARPKPALGAPGTLVPTSSTERQNRRSVPVSHVHRYFGVLVRTAAHSRFLQ